MNKLFISLSTIIAVFFIPGLASADLGPKPSMRFELVSGETFSIDSGQQIECDDSSCKDGKPLEEVGPQRFSCTKDSCFSSAYGYAPYHKLVLVIDGKKIESNIFKTKKFDSTYTVSISGNNLSVDGVSGEKVLVQQNYLSKTAVALFITLALECVMLFLAIAVYKLPWRILISFFIANISSVSVFWFLAIWFNISALLIVVIGEILIVFYEAMIYWLLLKKSYNYGKMVILSFALNLVSSIATMFIRI